MRSIRRVALLVTAGAITAFMGVGSLFADDAEEPWEILGATGTSTTFGSVVADVSDGSSDPVDAWEAAEPYVTTYLTTEVPSDTLVQVSVTDSVEVDDFSDGSSELP